MKRDTILRGNATPVYAFLSRINNHQADEDTFQGKKILDCAAGGPVPPLALFYQHGFECWGIDISDEQLNQSRVFCQKQKMDIHLRKGDMRQLPFDDESFDYVYEHYSMCHLSKKDTATAIQEMYRVLKPGGMCFLGVISTDTWPISELFGQEQAPGEYHRDRDEDSLHSAFTDAEADQLVAGWEILSKEKWAQIFQEEGENTSLEKWMALLPKAPYPYSKQEWQERYKERANSFHYTHTYFFLQKPAP